MQRQATRFNTMTRDMLPLPKVAVSASVHVPGPRVQEAFSALEAACKAAGICRDRSRSRTPSQCSPDSQAVPPEELQPDEQKDPGFQPDEEYPEGFQPDEQAYGVAPEADEQALQPAEQAYGAAPEEDEQALQPDEQAQDLDYDPFADYAPASARAGAMPKWWPAKPPPAVHPKDPPPQASHPKSYWRAGSQRFGARGSLNNPNVIWHSLRAKARREGWLEDFGRENSKLFLFARPGPEQKSR